jgi:predicted nucleic acid-binding protein
MRAQFEKAHTLFWPSVNEWQSAWDQYKQGMAGDAGVVDQVSFIIMRRLGITDAFTNDRHFKAAGFKTLF